MLSRIALTASRVSESRSSALNRSAAAGKTPLPTACANMTGRSAIPRAYASSATAPATRPFARKRSTTSTSCPPSSVETKTAADDENRLARRDSLGRVSRGRAVRLHGEEGERRQLAGADRDRERRGRLPERQHERGDRECDSGSERDTEDRERVAPLGGQEGGVHAVQTGSRDQWGEGEPDRQPVGRDGDQDRDVHRRPREDERSRDPQRRVEQRARRARPPREAGKERGVEGLAGGDAERDRDDQREEVGRARAGRAEQRGDDRDEDEREHALERERGEGEDAELAGRVVGESLLWRRFANG